MLQNELALISHHTIDILLKNGVIDVWEAYCSFVYGSVLEHSLIHNPPAIIHGPRSAAAVTPPNQETAQAMKTVRRDLIVHLLLPHNLVPNGTKERER